MAEDASEIVPGPKRRSKSGASQRPENVRSVERAARIVITLAEHPYAMGVLEIADRVQLSPGSVHRLLATLVNIGWVEQNVRTLKYRLGTRMLGVGSSGLRTNPAVNIGMTYLAQISARSGYDTLMSTLVGMRVVYLARVPGRDQAKLDFQPGLSQPAHATADGKLLLSYLPVEMRNYLFGVDGLASYTPHTITDPGDLEAELSQIREQGYAVDRGELLEDALGIAVPLPGPLRPNLAIVCIGPLDLSAEQLTAQARQMTSVARDLGGHLARIGDLSLSS